MNRILTNKRTNERMGNYDLFRVIQAFFVVVIHVNAYFLNIESNTITVTTIVQNFINVITRITVPGFFMLSGAFILHGKSINNPVMFYRNAIYKILLPFLTVYLFWGCFYSVKAIINSESFVKVAYIWIKGTFGNLWFMPVLCMIYLIAPILNCLRKTMGDYIFKIITVFMLIWAIVSAVTTTYTLPYSMGNVISYLAYFMMGYILLEVKPTRRKKGLYPVVIAIVAIITTWFRVEVSQVYALDPYKAFFSPMVVLMSILAFSWFGMLKVQSTAILKWLSDKTYYIYLVHSIVIYVLLKVSDIIYINPIIKVVVLSIMGFFISLVLAVIWTYFRKVLDKRLRIKQSIVGN